MTKKEGKCSKEQNQVTRDSYTKIKIYLNDNNKFYVCTLGLYQSIVITRLCSYTQEQRIASNNLTLPNKV